MLAAANCTDNKVAVTEVSKDWYRWCRLCANDDIQNVNIFLKDENAGIVECEEQLKLADAVRRYFCVEIRKEETQLPQQLCVQCFALLTTIVGYHKRVSKVQEMYTELQSFQNSQLTDGGIQTLRSKLGVLRDYRPLDTVTQSLGNAQLLFEAKQTEHKVEETTFNVESEAMGRESTHSTSAIKEEEFTDVAVPINEDMCVLENDDMAEDPFASDNEGIDENDKNASDDNELNTKRNEKSVKISNDEAKKEIKENQNKHSAETKAPESQSTAQATEWPNKTTPPPTKRMRAPEPKEIQFVCDECPLKFRRIGSYRLHLHKKHGKPLPTLSCTQCSKIFKTEYDLRKHMNIHRPVSEKNIFPCPQCERKFQNKDYVATHIKFVHEDIRPFVCEECGEAVRTEAALREHMLTHTDYAEFECDVCKKRFKNRPRLKKHLETHSSNKYTCDQCGLQLNSRATLNEHKLVHSDEMPHKCDYCGRAFKRAKTLKSHLILHSGLKPYSCDFCDRRFANGPNCRTHKLKAHPEELAALEASGGKAYTKNIPKLSVLKTVIRTVENLTPVAGKNSGRQKKVIENDPKCTDNAVATVTIPPATF